MLRMVLLFMNFKVVKFDEFRKIKKEFEKYRVKQDKLYKSDF